MKNRNLKIGDCCLTDYENVNSKNMKSVVITDRKENCQSQSRIMYKVKPSLRNGSLDSWYDADWFYTYD